MTPTQNRVIDFMVAAVMAVVFLPLFLVIAGLSVLFGKRPVFYSEKRVGLNGREFTLYKFRTLRPDIFQGAMRHDWTDRLYKHGVSRRCTGSFFRILRKYSLDELPQIWNILKGDMSTVGPRPMPAGELEFRFGSDAPRITSVRPGLTGLWQVSGRNDLDPEQRRSLDLYYVENRNLWLDCRIMLKTLPQVILGRGAY